MSTEIIASTEHQLPIPYGWYGVGYSDELQVGEVKHIHYFGNELVLFRTESGLAKVLDAYCPHLGAHLGHGGKVRGESIACPFHGWEFNGGGQCTAVPYAKQMPPKVANGQQVIYAYPVAERNQVIWAWYHPQHAAPRWEVPEVPEFSSDDWTPLQRFDWKINAAPQETGENAVDAAHFQFVHGTAGVPKGATKFEGRMRISEYKMTVPKIDDEGQLVPGEFGEVHLISSGNIQRFSGQFEAVLMSAGAPISAGAIHMKFAFTQPKNLSPGKKLLADLAIAEICRQVEGDIPIWEHKIYLDNPTLCDGDGPIAQYRKWFAQFYAQAS
ncbi:MAG TPA: Rieske 2Fe-2S domain-containing protein [Spongiibacteraceae bacterium]|nr:Rieske 2Fe-2S domain-containing protein [Spongiibacteraceae bacterium]